MTKLEQLIQELCPDGVDFKRIGECCRIEKGKTPIQKATPGEYPLVVTTSERKTSNTYQFEEPTVCIPLVSSRGHGVASLNEVYYQDGKFALGNILCGITPLSHKQLSAKFLCKYLNHKKDVLIVPLMRGGANVSLSADSLKRIRIPVPPLEVQAEIVRILDTFTELTTELTTELANRKKQYEYYRNSLLSFDTIVKKCRISDVCEISRGKVISKDDIRNNAGGYPVYSSQTENNGELGKISSYMYDGEYLTWTTDGANAGSIFYRSGKFNITNVCGLLKVDTKNVDIRYLFHALTVEAPKYVRSGMGNPKLMSNVMGSIKISFPELPIQRRIARVLDNFEAICSDLNIGLPAEIKARQKQYEYYRDKLLTFTMKE